jgi:hypothetical protein
MATTYINCEASNVQYPYASNYTEVWAGWNQAYATTTVCNDVVWVNWQYCVTGGQATLYSQPSYVQPTPEEQALRAQQAAKREEEQKLALAKAEELLFLFLTDEQKKSYKEKRYFETEVNDTKYRIYKGRGGNIKKIVDGKEVVSMCVHVADYIPDDDNVLGQLLALHTDAAQLERTANHTRLC